MKTYENQALSLYKKQSIILWKKIYMVRYDEHLLYKFGIP